MSRTMNIPIFIPHNGCPNDCVFCNQRKISGLGQSQSLEDVKAFIQESIHTSGNRSDIEIAFFGGSFTGLDKDIQKAYLDLGAFFVNKYNLKGIRMSTRPDYINADIMEFLEAYPVSSIELGVQSLNEKVLKASKRKHSVEDVYEAVKLIKKANIELGLQMMIGLPEDSLEFVKETLQLILEFEPKTVRIYPTLVIKDTELEELYLSGRYRALSLDEAVEQVSLILPIFTQHNIDVLRVGLQANEGLNSGDYIAGPYHPAFKELVMDRIIYNEIMSRCMYMEDSLYTVLASGKLFNRLVGHKKENKRAFANKGITILCDDTMEEDLIQIRGVQASTVFTFRL